MTMKIRGTVGLLLLFGVGLTTPGYAVAEPGAKLYELTENMSLNGKKNPFRRATSELAGFAKVGTPLCPRALVDFYNPGATFCFLNATGTDNISTQTGLGTFNGTFTVVVQGDNAVDSPEKVIAKGKFLGDMNFKPAILFTIPLGSVTGTVWLNGRGDDDHDEGGVPFTGVFRLPFVLPADLLPAETGCNPMGENGLTAPIYLLNAPNDRWLGDIGHWTCATVQDAEKALAFPTVRFEISFP
jgi:hypothetical protein